MQHNHAVRAGGRFAATLGIHLMKQLFQRAALLALALCAPFAVQAQANLTGGTYSENFNTLSNTAGSTTRGRAGLPA